MPDEEEKPKLERPVFTVLEDHLSDYKKRLWSLLIREEVASGFVYNLTNPFPFFTTDNHVHIVRMLRDLRNPQPVQLVGGTELYPIVATVAAGLDYVSISATIAASTTYDFSTDLTLINPPRAVNDIDFTPESQQCTVTLNIGAGATNKVITVAAGITLKVRGLTVNFITVVPAASTNIILLADD